MKHPLTEQECSEHIAMAIFDSFAKVVIKNEGRNLQHSHAHQMAHEVVTENPVRYASYVDQYPSDENVIYAAGFACSIRDEVVYNALLSLPNNQLEALVLHFWQNWGDQEIAQRMHVVDRTVRKWRQKSFAQLRCILCKGAYDHES